MPCAWAVGDREAPARRATSIRDAFSIHNSSFVRRTVFVGLKEACDVEPVGTVQLVVTRVGHEAACAISTPGRVDTRGVFCKELSNSDELCRTRTRRAMFRAC